MKEMLEKLKESSKKINESLKSQQISQNLLAEALKSYHWDDEDEKNKFLAEFRANSIEISTKNDGLVKLNGYDKVSSIIFH